MGEFSLVLAATKNPVLGYVLIAVLLVFWAGVIIWGRRARTVCKVAVDRDSVVISLFGPARILSLRKQVVFPLDSVTSVRLTPNVFSEQGTFSRRIGSWTIPTFFKVGSFRGARDSGATFWACFTGETAVTFELTNNRYRWVVIDVDDPQATYDLLQRYGL
ncbi:MAG: hypothetical protein EPN30_05700 [Actinomycetota bacterium]|nr:MAG: hypothetical protein EPN30_05700 [Actinomycetota bacterium]